MNDSVRRYDSMGFLHDFGMWVRWTDYDQLATRLAASEAEVAGLKIARDNLTNALYAKQAKIDALMLEFCPGEMPAEQRAEWAKNQRRVTQEEHDGIQRAYLSSVTVVDSTATIEAERDSLRDKLAKLEALVNVRAWSCEDCGVSHDRDINAAKNILARGKAFPSVSRNEAQP